MRSMKVSQYLKAPLQFLASSMHWSTSLKRLRLISWKLWIKAILSFEDKATIPLRSVNTPSCSLCTCTLSSYFNSNNASFSNYNPSMTYRSFCHPGQSRRRLLQGGALYYYVFSSPLPFKYFSKQPMATLSIWNNPMHSTMTSEEMYVLEWKRRNRKQTQPTFYTPRFQQIEASLATYDLLIFL